MTGPELERLLAEDAWLRRLARRLAGDAATADDLVQETWAAALAAGGTARAAPARPWLAGTLRNRWRMLVRGDARRTARERDAAAPEPHGRADAVAHELELRRAVVDALLALAEPDRGVVFRRFFKDASLAAIAAEDGVAASTAHARLERGLERMRARLDAAHGEGNGARRVWALGLLRIAGATPGEPGSLATTGAGAPRITASGGGAARTTWLGGALVTTTVYKAVAAVLAVGVLGLWWQGRGSSGAASGGARAAALAEPGAPLVGPEPVLDGGGEVAASPVAAERRAVARSATVAAAFAPPAPGRTVRGTVVDPTGAPLAGVAVTLLAKLVHGPSLATALPPGHPEIGSPPAPESPPGDAPPEPPPGDTPPAPPAEVERGSESAHLGAAVTDVDGVFAIHLPADAPGAALAPDPPGGGDAIDAARAISPRRFALDDPRLLLVVATQDDAGAPLLVAAPRATFAGVVIDPEGAPAPGIEVQLVVGETLLSSLGRPHAINVHLPSWSTRTDELGRFRLEDVVGGEHVHLHVPWGGLYVSGPHEVPVHDDLGIVLRLRLRDGVLAVRGLVVDAAGAPVPGAEVAVGGDVGKTDAEGRFELAWDTEHGRGFAAAIAQGMHPRPKPQTHAAAYKEGLGCARVELSRELVREPIVLRLGGAPLAIEGRVVDGAGAPVAGAQVWMTDPTHFGSRRRNEGGMVFIEPESLEELRAGARWAETDAEGRFRLGGLLDRDYVLRTFDPRTSSFGADRTIAAGSAGVELRLPVEPSVRRVAGRLVSLGGKPLAGVEVRPARDRGRSELEWAPEPLRLGTRTDSEGRFAFHELATAGTDLIVFGGPRLRYQAERYDLASFSDLERVELVLPLSCELQIVLLDASTATAARVLGADGEPLDFLVHHGSFTAMTAVAAVVEGRSSVISVSELAREVLLLREGEEVVRLPVRVDPNRRTTVEF